MSLPSLPTSRRHVLTALAGAAALLAMAGPARAMQITGEPKIAFIYGATAQDGGWNEAIDAARVQVEQIPGVTVAVTENVPEEATALRNAIDLYVKRGFNIIVGTTYGYSDGILEAAKQYPNVAFVNASGATNAANLEGFYARTYQGWYLAGMAAAGVSKSGKLGIVGGFPVGVVNWDVNAFTLGARAINPAAQVTVVYTNSWWDPVKEGQVTEALLDQGIDVIANNLSSSAPFIAAEKRGVPSIGFQLDMRKHAPEGSLTSVMFNWSHYLVPTIQAMVDGTWKPSEYGAFPGMAEGVVELAPLSPKIPPEVVAKMDAAKAAMVAGTFSPFQGPIKKQDGSEAVAAGATIDDGALWAMDYLVEGTIGTMPAAQ
ncbi:MAG: BMP family ABC transporter substrate-binding protein [Geminicoccaceae bacterium]